MEYLSNITNGYICMSISWAWTISTCWNIILQRPLPISNTIINCLSNKHNSAAANVSRCQSRLNVVTRMSCNLLSLSRKEFKFVPHFFILLLGIPHNLNEVLLGTPTQLQSLLQYFERKGDETEHSMLSNANQEFQVY